MHFQVKIAESLLLQAGATVDLHPFTPVRGPMLQGLVLAVSIETHGINTGNRTSNRHGYKQPIVLTSFLAAIKYA